MGEAFTLLNLVIMGLWVAGILAALGIRGVNSRRRLDRRATRELADQLGLVFDEHGAGGGVGAFGQLPDGRRVHLYEELKRRPRGLLPWQRGLRVAPILEVGLESEAWERLTADQRDEARRLVAGHFHRAWDGHREELVRLGFGQVSVSGQALRVRTGYRLPTPESMKALLDALGRLAYETEATCIERVLTGREGAAERTVGEGEPAAPKAPEYGESAPPTEQPWSCPTCQALNPAELNRCQMCAVSRNEESHAEYAGEPGDPPPG